MPDAAPHILVIDDDDRLRALLGRFLSEHGFAVSQAGDAAVARKLMGLFIFDLLVLDVMMPGESGISLAGSLRKQSSAPPILMLSALAEAGDRVAGLEAGVDDYVPKPFDPKELLLRIRAILRRSASDAAGGREVVFGEYVFVLENAQLMRGEQAIHLTAAEASLLKLLAESVGEAVPREKLTQVLGGGNERSVDVQVTRLRKKIEPDAARPQHIQTVRGAGYALYGSRR